MLEDRVLVWRFNHGRPEVLHLVYEKYKTDLLTLAMALLGDLAAAEDVVQDVFLSLLKLIGPAQAHRQSQRLFDNLCDERRAEYHPGSPATCDGRV